MSTISRLPGWLGAWVLTVGAALVGGCGDPRPVEPPASLEQAQYNAAWDATLETLRAYNFDVDRQDRRAGVVTTLPLLGQHWFEFWRKDAATAYDLAESSIHRIYRTATVQIAPTGDDRGYAADVTVRVSRSSAAQRRVGSTGEAYGMFLWVEDEEDLEADDAPPVLEESPELPDDEALAAKIERDIAGRAERLLARQGASIPIGERPIPVQPAPDVEPVEGGFGTGQVPEPID